MLSNCFFFFLKKSFKRRSPLLSEAHITIGTLIRSPSILVSIKNLFHKALRLYENVSNF